MICTRLGAATTCLAVQFLAVSMTLCAFPQVVAGSQILDQSWTDTSRATTYTGFSGGSGIAAQTFTVGIAGTLSNVEVYVERQQNDQVNPGELEVSIWAVNAGLPTVELEKRLVPHNIVPVPGQPGWVDLDFSTAGIRLSLGEQFAVVLASGTTYTNYSWWGSLDDPHYPGGRALDFPYVFDEWITPLSEQHYSHFFRQSVKVVPEPGAFILSSLGVFFLCLGRWRRNRTST